MRENINFVLDREKNINQMVDNSEKLKENSRRVNSLL